MMERTRNRSQFNMLKYDGDIVNKVYKDLGLPIDTPFDPGSAQFVASTRQFQRMKGLAADGIFGQNTLFEVECIFLKYSEAEKEALRIIRHIMQFESGGRPDAANRDGEFRGLFKGHSATGRVHIGLSLGFIQMTQDGGTLGQYFKRCHFENPQRFEEIMGDNFQEVIRVTTLPGPSGFRTGTLRGPRVQKIATHKGGPLVDLWEEPWVSRCQTLARDTEFRYVQYELAMDIYLKPMLPLLRAYRLLSEKAVAIAFDLAVHRGVSGATTVIRRFCDAKFSENTNLTNLAREMDLLSSSKESRTRRLLQNRTISWDQWKGF